MEGLGTVRTRLGEREGNKNMIFLILIYIYIYMKVGKAWAQYVQD